MNNTQKVYPQEQLNPEDDGQKKHECDRASEAKTSTGKAVPLSDDADNCAPANGKALDADGNQGANLMGANLKGPWSPSTTRGLGAPHPARLVRPALSHMPRQSPTGTRLHSQAPPSVNSTGPSPPRRGSAREYCRSSSKSLLLQPRSLKRPLDKQTGASSYSTPAE